jgi:pimeloyl-ACP methyl ester carboxylesterase
MKVNGFRMHYIVAGSGYPLVFLHGWPQTSYEWRKIIPSVAERFTIIAPDLRGLGDSECPLTGYDKRTLASDVYQLIRGLGYGSIGLTGHDWGGTVAYYLAYDHPEMVKRLLILESIPGTRGDELELRGIRRQWHVFFHGCAPDLAEVLVRDHIGLYLDRLCSVACYNPALFSRDEMAEYVRAYSRPGSLRAGFHLLPSGIGRGCRRLQRMHEEARNARSRLGRGTLHGRRYCGMEARSSGRAGRKRRTVWTLHG